MVYSTLCRSKNTRRCFEGNTFKEPSRNHLRSRYKFFTRLFENLKLKLYRCSHQWTEIYQSYHVCSDDFSQTFVLSKSEIEFFSDKLLTSMGYPTHIYVYNLSEKNSVSDFDKINLRLTSSEHTWQL